MVQSLKEDQGVLKNGLDLSSVIGVLFLVYSTLSGGSGEPFRNELDGLLLGADFWATRARIWSRLDPPARLPQ